MGWLRLRDSDPDGPDAVYHEISAPGLVCGRSQTADWTVDDKTLSRRHARFYRDGGQDYVEDLRSTNGTSVNGERVRDSRPLADGDEVRLGDLRIAYELLPPIHLAETPFPSGASTWTTGEPDAESSPSPSPSPGVTAPADVEPLRDTERWAEVSLVGRGGMGEVYRAVDRDLGVTVAIKRLRHRDDESRAILERLHAREAAIARTIRHPNVVQVLEDGIHQGDPYMLLEWVQGPTFDRFLAQSRSNLGDRIECLRQVAVGLAAAHEAGVVHADLKPANILVTDASTSKPKDNLSILESPEESDQDADVDADAAALREEITRRLGLEATPDFSNAPFVGREGELALLEQIAAEVVEEGEASYRWIILYGERGAGKRRLCEALGEVVRDREWTLMVEIAEEWGPPPPDFAGLWLSMLPPLLPDVPELLHAYERERLAGTLCEIYLKPFLRGQAIRLVERIVNHPPSARAFIDAVDAEVGGNPARLVERLERSFEQGAWSISGSGHRFKAEVLSPDDSAVARRLIERLPAEEKGLRDLLLAISPLGGNLDFDAMLAASELPSATLFYLVDHGVRSGFLVRDARGECSIAVEPFRLYLESKLDPKTRARIAKRALPRLHERIAGGTAPAALHLRVGRLERQLHRPDRAFRVLLKGALLARASYERDLFLASIDEARDIYRETIAKRSAHRLITQTLEEFLGGEGRGYTGLERLRRLPIAVRVHLTDFGIARKLVAGETTRQDDDGQPWGTPRYMSPEQAKRSALSPASDVFSLGTIMRETFEGAHPLGKLRGRAAVAALIGGGVHPPARHGAGGSVPDGLRLLVTRMLSYDAKERPTALEVARALEQFQLRAATEVYP